MRARHAASGFFGVIIAAAFAFAPTLVVKNVKAKMAERSAGRAHGIVQSLADAHARSNASGEAEHSEGRLHEPVAPEAEEDPSPSVTPSKQVAAAPSPKPSARAATAPVKEAANAPDVGVLREVVAARLESLPICRRPGGPEGPGIAEITFTGDGYVRIALSAPYANTPVGACVARRLSGPPTTFDGEPVTLRVRFEL